MTLDRFTKKYGQMLTQDCLILIGRALENTTHLLPFRDIRYTVHNDDIYEMFSPFSFINFILPKSYDIGVNRDDFMKASTALDDPDTIFIYVPIDKKKVN